MRQVRASICKFEKRKSPYRVRWKPRISDKHKTQWFSSRAQAEAFKKQTELYENGFSDLSENANLQEIRETQLLLKQTENKCAKGKSIRFAVEWFVKNYQGDEDLQSIAFYYKRYEKVRISAKGDLQLSKNQINSDKQLVGFNGTKSFVNTFGDLKPTELTQELLQEYLNNNSSSFHRGKAVTAFINWMLGKSKYYNKNKCLHLDPMEGVQYEPQNRNQLREIATNQEVLDLLHLTHSSNYNYSAGRWAFLFFTGVRPSECDRFWDPKYKLGWKNIDLDSDEPFIIIPSEIIRKKGRSFRRVFIRPGFLKILKTFKEGGEKEYPLINVKNWKRVYSKARKAIWGKRLTISTNLDEAKDITRHTFITNLYRFSGNIVDVTLESGTKESTLFNHYINPLVGKDSANSFFHKIDETALLAKANAETLKIDKSAIEELIERHGLEIDEEKEVPYVEGESYEDRLIRLMKFAQKVRSMIAQKRGGEDLKK